MSLLRSLSARRLSTRPPRYHQEKDSGETGSSAGLLRGASARNLPRLGSARRLAAEYGRVEDSSEQTNDIASRGNESQASDQAQDSSKMANGSSFRKVASERRLHAAYDQVEPSKKTGERSVRLENSATSYRRAFSTRRLHASAYTHQLQDSETPSSPRKSWAGLRGLMPSVRKLTLAGKSDPFELDPDFFPAFFPESAPAANRNQRSQFTDSQESCFGPVSADSADQAGRNGNAVTTEDDSGFADFEAFSHADMGVAAHGRERTRARPPLLQHKGLDRDRNSSFRMKKRHPTSPVDEKRVPDPGVVGLGPRLTLEPRVQVEDEKEFSIEVTFKGRKTLPEGDDLKRLLAEVLLTTASSRGQTASRALPLKQRESSLSPPPLKRPEPEIDWASSCGPIPKATNRPRKDHVCEDKQRSELSRGKPSVASPMKNLPVKSGFVMIPTVTKSASSRRLNSDLRKPLSVRPVCSARTTASKKSALRANSVRNLVCKYEKHDYSGLGKGSSCDQHNMDNMTDSTASSHCSDSSHDIFWQNPSSNKGDEYYFV